MEGAWPPHHVGRSDAAGGVRVGRRPPLPSSRAIEAAWYRQIDGASSGAHRGDVRARPVRRRLSHLLDPSAPRRLRLRSQYAAAYVGIHYGWSRLYDPTLIGPIEAANHLDGFAPFQHPPPDAWLACPFHLLTLPLSRFIRPALAMHTYIAPPFSHYTPPRHDAPTLS